jgi:hypothetical protein
VPAETVIVGLSQGKKYVLAFCLDVYNYNTSAHHSLSPNR